MITFHELEFRNFLACGNNPITIQLDRSKSTLIVGQNGSGKSTILDALSFALFGKAHRNVTKNGLVNSVNGKGTIVSVTFETAGHDFKIIRGIKPNIFEVWQNDKMIDQTASVRDYQKFLEQNILKLNHKSFHQIVVLGQSSFIPFMQLSSVHRRDVVEDLLDINIFSKMKGILKERNAVTKQDSTNIKHNLNNQKDKIGYQKRHINSLEAINKKADESTKEIEDEIITDIAKLKTEKSEYPKTLKNDLKELQSSKASLNQESGVCKHLIQELTKKGKFFEDNNECPECTQEINKQLKNAMLIEVKLSAKRTAKLVSTNKEKYSKTIKDIEKITTDITNFDKILTKIESKKIELDRVRENKPLKSNIRPLHDDLNDLILEADELYDNLNECNDKLLYNEIAWEMLKDTGIRTKVIREYLPAMNTLINQYLQTLDFFVAFTLNEHFDETIRSRHRDKFRYDNFSEGEKMRIDLSLLFTWRQIAKMKNSTNTNLLILDETFDSSLDADGVDNLMKILLTLEDYTNTFIISHKPDMLESKLQSKIEFKKINNFSTIYTGN